MTVRSSTIYLPKKQKRTKLGKVMLLHEMRESLQYQHHDAPPKIVNKKARRYLNQDINYVNKHSKGKT
jgi:hypothetical protein